MGIFVCNLSRISEEETTSASSDALEIDLFNSYCFLKSSFIDFSPVPQVTAELFLS
ncbi:hypothetical protein [Aphanizomenon flos-aquae]|uniref:hypothetical protein n=1 Tax=Aphanizomenon flos-aquae TaxID=1176 RepID=UPI001F1BF22B|nr:hypothetical protein [Aphanizomenon flos-aquae]